MYEKNCYIHISFNISHNIFFFIYLICQTNILFYDKLKCFVELVAYINSLGQSLKTMLQY